MNARSWARIAFSLAAIFVVGQARGSCFFSPSFGQLAQACDAGASYCYVRSPGLDTTASMSGSFWALGYGNPVHGQGNDNGSWLPAEQWLHGPKSYLAGDWSDARVDGCIDGKIASGETTEIMAVGLSDIDIFGQEGFFAAAAVAKHPMASPEFDFASGIQRDIVLRQIPLPFHGVGPNLAVFDPINPEDVAPGFYSDGAATQGQVVVGYRVYFHDGYDVPHDRHRTAWTAFSPVVPLGQRYTVNQCFCCGNNSGVMTFVYALVFASGFETDYVSRQRTHYLCIPEDVFDLDGDGEYPPYYGGADCNDDNPWIYSGAPEINDGIDNECPGNPGYGSIDEISGVTGFYHEGDKSKLTWHTQSGALTYRVARSERPDFAGSCTTLVTPLGTLTDADEPPPGKLYHYLVSAETPHAGSWGQRSGGQERTVDCP